MLLTPARGMIYNKDRPPAVGGGIPHRMEEAYLIEIKNLTALAGDASPEGVSMTFRNGIYGLIGSHAADLLATVAGVYPVESGKILVSGYDVGAQPNEAKRRMGYMPHPLPLPSDMTVGEYLGFVAAIKGLKDDALRRRVREVITATGIGDVQNRLLQKLSPTECLRVGLAQALLADPDALLLDNPCAEIDGEARSEMHALIRETAKGRTVLIAADATESAELCDILISLSDGQEIAVEKPSVAYDEEVAL